MIDYSSLISDKAKTIKPSGIRKFFDIVSTMEDAISLGVGEPDFDTPFLSRRKNGNTVIFCHSSLGTDRRFAS